jgi:hypothetical protein
MGRGQKLKNDVSDLSSDRSDESKIEPGNSPEDEARNDIDPAGDGDIGPEGSNEGGNPDDTSQDKKENLDDIPQDKEGSSDDVPIAVPLKRDEKKVTLVLVKAATYTAAGDRDIGKIKKNVPFEADAQTAKKLLATGLFEEKG